MHRNLSPIGENDHLTSSSDATSYDDLPMVTPKVRTFDDTTQRQNAENAQLRKQLLAYQEKENKLHDRVQELEELTAALVNPTGRNPTDKTENNSETRTSASAFTPQAAIPSSPLGLTPRVPRPQDVAYQAALKQRPATQTEAGEKLTAELNTQHRDRGSQIVLKASTSTYRQQQHRRLVPATLLWQRRRMGNLVQPIPHLP